MFRTAIGTIGVPNPTAQLRNAKLGIFFALDAIKHFPDAPPRTTLNGYQ